MFVFFFKTILVIITSKYITNNNDNSDKFNVDGNCKLKFKVKVLVTVKVTVGIK